VSARRATDLYVYYRVAVDTAAAREAVARLFAAVRSETGVTGRLLARCDDAGTWMEVYAGVPDAAFAPRLDALVRAHGVDAIATDGRRHTEAFAPLPAEPAGATDRTSGAAA
jgi:hypothetical protein